MHLESVSVRPAGRVVPVPTALFDENGGLTDLGTAAILIARARGLDITRMSELEAMELVAGTPKAKVRVRTHRSTVPSDFVASVVEAVAAPVVEVTEPVIEPEPVAETPVVEAAPAVEVAPAVTDAARGPRPAHGKYADAPVSPRKSAGEAAKVVGYIPPAPKPAPAPRRAETANELRERLGLRRR